MVSIVENWSRLEGRVEGLAKSGECPGHMTIEILVITSGEVPGFPNLLADSAGKLLDVNVRGSVEGMAGIRPGVRVVLKARRADRGRIFGDPHSLRILDA